MKRERKPPKTFADIAAARTHYNPRVEGYGNSHQWRGTFFQRMGWEKARRIINEQERTPREILGVGLFATWQEIRSAYRKLAMDFHPDRAAMNGMSEDAATVAFQEIGAAFEWLEHEFGK
jgi:DnaJ-class molecular chaperone